ncbi:MAG TPA: hypothetical protein VJ875_09100 [Pyrinomonadaceae bacterium]|nr:hypothetical protein [Pyrinomonadaceae bacterium]
MTYWLIIILAFTSICSVGCSSRTAGSGHRDTPHAVFVSNDLQSVYAADPNDSWNRIFHALFSRNLNVRVATDFQKRAPSVAFRVHMGSFATRISKDTVDRTEIGDRAIEPLYPAFFTEEGPLQVLTEPRFSDLTAALGEAIEDSKPRSPVERALMQSDLWAAYDIVYSIGPGRNDKDSGLAERKSKLLELFSRLIHKLALSTDQINSLNSNYSSAVSVKRLPDIFAPESGWLEIELLPNRSHDHAAGYRRASRVFLKPRSPQSDAAGFVEKLKHGQDLDEVEAVALAVQNLLIDASGRIVPSPLFSDVQFRFFTNDPSTGMISTTVQEFELSRRQLLTQPSSGGLLEFDSTAPAYLSAAGNDYGFATRIEEAHTPVLVPLRTRCSQCHGTSLTSLMTYSIHDFLPVPTVKILNSSAQERALYVAQLKSEREDFKSLVAKW